MQPDYPCLAWTYHSHEDSIAAMAARVLAAVEGPIVPIGLSMGGIVALEMWRQAPQRLAALALFATNPGPDTPERFAGRQRQLAVAEGSGMESLVQEVLAPAYFGQRLSTSQALAGTVAAMAADAGTPTLAAQSAALASRANSWSSLPDIEVPVLVVFGTDDVVCPRHDHLRMVDLLPQATGVELATTGHLVPLERPDQSSHALRAWLENIGLRGKKMS
jgi:pimeloyl-ACP methyl ester carboxylesterase